MVEKKVKAEVKKKEPRLKKEKPTAERKVEAEPKISKVEAVQCADKHCPKHSNFSIRGMAFTGTVIKDKMSKTVIVEWPRRVLVPKFERFMKKRSRVAAHNPICINAKAGDKVRIAECRPISKTKAFVVVEVMK